MAPAVIGDMDGVISAGRSDEAGPGCPEPGPRDRATGPSPPGDPGRPHPMTPTVPTGVIRPVSSGNIVHATSTASNPLVWCRSSKGVPNRGGECSEWVRNGFLSQA